MKLTDNEILNGWRTCDTRITRDYFYPYCRAAWYLSDRRYNLVSKHGMDFYSLTHEYYIKLAQKQWKPLTHRKAGVSLRTYLINGYHFLVLDELKVYNRQNHLENFDERVANGDLRFDVAEDTIARDYYDAIEDICANLSDYKDAMVLRMRMLDGYMGKEISVQMGLTPSAVSQRFRRLWEKVVLPYFRGEELHEHEITGLPPSLRIRQTRNMEEPCVYDADELSANAPMAFETKTSDNIYNIMDNRITPDRITELRENEVFVFGSNLAGMHGGGAARLAHMKFGAVMGQGVGMQGQSYAIPTMQGGIETIRPYVNDFIDYARRHPEKKFLVTQIGCGIAGFSPEEIAPLFRAATDIDNICLPQSFWNILA